MVYGKWKPRYLDYLSRLGAVLNSSDADRQPWPRGYHLGFAPCRTG